MRRLGERSEPSRSWVRGIVDPPPPSSSPPPQPSPVKGEGVSLGALASSGAKLEPQIRKNRNPLIEYRPYGPGAGLSAEVRLRIVPAARSRRATYVVAPTMIAPPTQVHRSGNSAKKKYPMAAAQTRRV